MGVTPVYGWRTPEPGVAANGPEAFSTLASDIENTLTAAGWKQYNPSWGSNGSQQPANPASKVGRYQLEKGYCDFSIFMSFGGTSNGGRGQLNLSLPVAASNALLEQVVSAKLWVPGVADWQGIGLINAGTATVWPMFTAANNNSTITYWLNNDNTGAAGTGIPNMPGHWTVESGGNIVITGRYLTV